MAFTVTANTSTGFSIDTGNTVATFNSSTGGDGEVYANNATWATVRSATSGTADNTSTTAAVYTEPGYWFGRVFLPFDSSALPDGATIVSAKVRVYVDAVLGDNDNDGDDFIRLVESTQASSTGLVNGDFDQLGTTALANDIDITSISAGGFIEFILNSTGLALLNDTGYTKFGLREGHDINDNPTGTGITGIRINTSDNASNDPELVVAYTVGGTNYTLTADAGSFSITGTAANLERNLKVVANTGSYVITGTAANLERSLKVVANAGSYSITGTAANLGYNRKVVADTGTFLITGANANLESSREVFAESGSVIITGTDATLRKSINMTADSGSFAVSGTNATLTATRRLTASSGSVTVTGTDASFRKSINFNAEAGAITLTGTSASLEYNRRLVADTGVFTLTGTDASLESSKEVFAESGTVTITGTDATLSVHRKMVADSGSYSILGTAVTFELARRLLADSGTVEITGTDATLDYQQGYFLNAESGSVVITGTPTRITFDVIPTIQGRNYYIDSNGSVYWVISENIGLVEKV